MVENYLTKNFRKYYFLLFSSFLLLIFPKIASSVPLEELFYTGRAIPFYGAVQTEKQAGLLRGFQETKLAERMAQLTNETIKLRQDLQIGFISCGAPNAFFKSDRNAIVICVEMVELIIDEAKKDKDVAGKWNPQQIFRALNGALWGIFFHELAHAVTKINRVAITGREEDVADQFIVYYAINFVESKDVSVVFPTIWFFDRLAQSSLITSANQEDIKRILADEHSLNGQRIYNLACWALGGKSKDGNYSANFVKLPLERGNRCQSEYSTLNRAFVANFSKYFKISKY